MNTTDWPGKTFVTPASGIRPVPFELSSIVQPSTSTTDVPVLVNSNQSPAYVLSPLLQGATSDTTTETTSVDLVGDVGDRQRVRGAGRVRRATDSRVVDDDGDVVARLALVVEDDSGLQVQTVAVDLEEGGVRAGDREVVRAEPVVGDEDPCDLHATGGVRVLEDRAACVRRA